jgi:peptidoglycan/LPS O-acetylase OafA/YrhL
VEDFRRWGRSFPNATKPRPAAEARNPDASLVLKPLTALRILAALWLVVGNYGEDLRSAGPAGGLIAHGQYGVELFFVLSGFILSHVYFSGFGTDSATTWWNAWPAET